ncbi:YdgA family protein [Deinococcus sp.]|uniref:YdgA family protein n=1 Tax=Deinococcus sp. TaxID=47478 RepID=UPI002869A795|nr:YdgA family protein [Deinococcus sp.]
MISNPPPAPPRRTARRSPLPAIGLTVLVALGAFAGATAIFAGRTQTLARDLTTQLNTAASATGVVTVTQTAYQRGLTSSTQTMTIRMQPQGSDRPLDMILTNHIQHGPLPGLRSVGQAIIDTDIAFKDPQVQAAYVKAFPNRKPTLHTVVGLGGGTDSALDVPAGTVTDQGTTVTWQAASGTLNVAGPDTRSALTWPGLTVVSSDGGATLSGLTANGTSRRTGDVGSLGTGSGTLAVQKIAVTGSGQAFDLGGLKVSSDTTESGGYYSSAMKYDAATMNVAGQVFDDLQLHMGMNHLAGAPLQRILTVIQNAQKAAGTPATSGRAAMPDFTAAQQQQLQADVLALLKGQPVIQLERLSVRRPAGDVVVSGQVSVPGAATLNADQLAHLAQAPMMIGSMVSANLDVRGAEAAVTELLGSFGQNGAGVAQNLHAMEQDGYVTRSGGNLSTKLRVHNGDFTMNGKSLGQ